MPHNSSQEVIEQIFSAAELATELENPLRQLIAMVVYGRILEDNLKRMGLDAEWIQKQSKDQDLKNSRCLRPEQAALALQS